MGPADEAEGPAVAYTARGLGGLEPQVDIESLLHELAAPAELERVVVSRHRTHRVAHVAEIVAVEARGTRGRGPQVATFGGEGGAQRPGFGIAIGAVADHPAVVAIAFDVEA